MTPQEIYEYIRKNYVVKSYYVRRFLGFKPKMPIEMFAFLLDAKPKDPSRNRWLEIASAMYDGGEAYSAKQVLDKFATEYSSINYVLQKLYWLNDEGYVLWTQDEKGISYFKAI